MPVMTQEGQDPAPVRRPASGIAIDPARLTWYRENQPWSRQDLSDAVNRLGLADENGVPLTVTRDAIAKIENGERKPKARTVRALCEALGITVRDLMPGGEPLVPHGDAEERRLRLAHNRDLRVFARAHGIQYRNPVSGRVYYSVPLEEAFAASVAGYDSETLAALVAAARGPAGPGDGGLAAAALPQAVLDDGIEELDLSVRTHNTLIRAGLRTIADLTRTRAADLEDLRGFGTAALREVREKLKAAGFALAEPEPAPQPVPGPEPAPVAETAPDTSHAWPGFHLTGTDSIVNLHLTARSQNMLLREGIGTIGELAALTEGSLRDIRNLGARSRADIREKLAAAGFTLAGEEAGSRDPELLAS